MVKPHKELGLETILSRQRSTNLVIVYYKSQKQIFWGETIPICGSNLRINILVENKTIKP